VKKLEGGMRSFVIIWIGQMFSLLGTSMSGFGLTVWAYELTGSATALALVSFFFLTPMLIVSPLAGALVDRSNRKLMMMLSDLASGLATISLLILFSTGRLQIWHLYVANGFMGTFQAFQWPAFSAAITTMLPKEQYGRANGLMSLTETGPEILAPILAGALLGLIGLGGILTIDLVTLSIAILTLLSVNVPQPAVTQVGIESRGSLWKESLFGFSYILKRPSLLALQLVFLMGNFFFTIAYTLSAPMILARTGNNELALGTVNSIGAIGGVVGAAVLTAWGGPKRKVHGVLSGWGLSGLFGATLMGLGKSIPVWTGASFISSFLSPFLNGSNQTIWQAKVAPDVQGKVFSTRMLIAWLSMPLATLVAGPLADKVAEPAMQPGGSLAPIFGPLVGVGPGAGMSLIILFMGLIITVIGFSGYAVPTLRNAETLLPDHDLIPSSEQSELIEISPAD
jgi:DHA3 family macrolide efflux protein-like MFS transporter